MLLLLHRSKEAAGFFRASPWYEQSCLFRNLKSGFIPTKVSQACISKFVVLLWKTYQTLLIRETITNNVTEEKILHSLEFKTKHGTSKQMSTKIEKK